MKKILFSLFLIISFSKIFAQQSIINAKFGANYSWLNSSGSSPAVIKAGSAIPNANLGVFDDITFGNLALHTGIEINGEGGKFTEDGLEKKISMYNVKLPVDLIINQHKSNNGFYIGGGVYAEAGANGRLKTYDGAKTKTISLSRFKGNSLYRGFNEGAEALAGYKFKSGFKVNVAYNSGFTNIISKNGNPDGNKSLNTRTVGLSAGYSFL